MAWKKGQFDVVKLMVTNQFKAFSINFKANMLMDLLILIWKIGKMHVRLLDTLEYLNVCISLLSLIPKCGSISR